MHARNAKTVDLAALKQKLAERNLNNHEFARRAGVAYATVKYVLNAGRQPSRKTLAKFAAALECTVEDLSPTHQGAAV